MKYNTAIWTQQREKLWNGPSYIFHLSDALRPEFKVGRQKGWC